MSNDDYLREVLRAHEVAQGSVEMKELEEARNDIELVLRRDFEAARRRSAMAARR